MNTLQTKNSSGTYVLIECCDASRWTYRHNQVSFHRDPPVQFKFPDEFKSPDNNANPLPTNAVKLANGGISIADQFNHRAIIINPHKHIVFQYGMTNQPGNGPDQLYWSYTSYVIGDFTGQSVPPLTFSSEKYQHKER